MKEDDLTKVKHIGLAREKRLKENGVTTIAQLHRIPVEELAGITSFSKRNAVLIKNAVNAYCSKQADKPPKTNKAIKASASAIDKQLRKSLKKLTKQLNWANEKLKPLWAKKYLSLYIDFKKRSSKLISHIKAIERRVKILPNKDKKKILKKSDALRRVLAKNGKKPKKKAYKQIIREIKLFSRMIKPYKI